jgi:hypothetical protein
MPHSKLFKTDSWEYGHETRAHEEPLEAPKKRRLLAITAFAVVFFAGASFAAVAGNEVVQQISNGEAAATSDISSTDASTTSADQAAATPDQSAPAAAPASDASASASASAPADASATASASPSEGSAAPSSDAAAVAPEQDAVAKPTSSSSAAAPAAAPSASQASPGTGPAAQQRTTKKTTWRQVARVVLLPKHRPAPPPEIEGPKSAATVWLNNPLPDPTPPVKRLSKKFARSLMSVSRSAGVQWSLVLAVLRAKGFTGHNPADKKTLKALAERLASVTIDGANDWAIALAYDGNPDFADKVQALARYDRAVGLRALVKGLESAKSSLGQRLLDDPAIAIYPGGRDDIANNKVDVRVLALISYLHQAFGEVTVSCLISGHRLYARPGVISAHIYGRAVDIAALGGTSILGHQQLGGLTQEAVKDILLLPYEVMPKQVISLLGLGGPSFPLADHFDHIHVGY